MGDSEPPTRLPVVDSEDLLRGLMGPLLRECADTVCWRRPMGEWRWSCSQALREGYALPEDCSLCISPSTPTSSGGPVR